MTKFYKCGEEFLAENRDILDAYLLETVFFECNANCIHEADENNFLVKIFDGDTYLIAVHNSQYPMVIFGDKSLCAEFARQAYEHKLTFDKVIGALDTCEMFLAEYGKLVKCTHQVNHSMDIMRCGKTLTSDVDGVEKPSDNDVNEIAELIVSFTVEALGDSADVDVVKQDVINRLTDFAVIRRNGLIVSVASVKRKTDKLACIADVYTLPQFRNQGLSCKIVTYLTLRITDDGKLAYLFVDKTNPISNHLYTKIGYAYAVPQYEIKLIKN